MNWPISKLDFGSIDVGGSAVVLNPDSATEEVLPQPPCLTILVVEDDDVQRELLAKQLTSVGLRTITASTVSQATSQLTQHAISLALVDVDLPDGSGLEFCERTVDDPRTANLPIIVLSSISDPYLVRRTRAAGGQYFICKPYDPNVLLAMIERILDMTL